MIKAGLTFKIATEAGEFEQIHRLNRKTFYDLALISGTTRQQKLYRHLGFEPFGPLVGAPGVQFQPMYLTLETSQSKFSAFFEELLFHDDASK